MSAEKKALLAAVGANPDDDLPRLVFADWLQENGEPERAEFIRLHIAWDRQPTGTPSDTDLRDRLVTAWDASGLATETFQGATHYVYHRGFIAGVGFHESKPSSEQIRDVFAHAPVQVADLWATADGEDAWLASSTLLARLKGFGCEGSLNVIGRLLALPHLSRLDLLHVRNSYPEEAQEVARHIAENSHIDRLTVLDLDGCHLEDPGLTILAGAKHLTSVRKLTMRSDNRSSHHVGEPGVRALADSTVFQQLTHLGFCECRINGAAIRRLLQWQGIGGLTELDLSFTHLNGNDVVRLARSRKFRNLRRLCLDAFGLTDKAVDALATASWLPTIRQLWIESREEYGDGDDQTEGRLDELPEQLGERLVMPATGELAFQLNPASETDRIWHRLRSCGWRDEDSRGSNRIL